MRKSAAGFIFMQTTVYAYVIVLPDCPLLDVLFF